LRQELLKRLISLDFGVQMIILRMRRLNSKGDN